MEKQILRQMAWQRAKGEMRSMLVTFVEEKDQYELLKQIINDFIEKVEWKSLQE